MSRTRSPNGSGAQAAVDGCLGTTRQWALDVRLALSRELGKRAEAAYLRLQSRKATDPEDLSTALLVRLVVVA